MRRVHTRRVLLGAAMAALVPGVGGARAKKKKHRLRGLASYYGRKFHGKPTASGEPFDMHKLTAAHRTLPFGTWVKVTTVGKHPRSVVVRVNDRGPWKKERVIDVSRAAAVRLGLVKAGMLRVRLQVVPAPKAPRG